jgi:hypothetical protein
MKNQNHMNHQGIKKSGKYFEGLKSKEFNFCLSEVLGALGALVVRAEGVC